MVTGCSNMARKSWILKIWVVVAAIGFVVLYYNAPREGVILGLTNSLCPNYVLRMRDKKPQGTLDSVRKEANIDPLQMILDTRMAQYQLFSRRNPDFSQKRSLHNKYYKKKEQTIAQLGYDPGEQPKDFEHTVRRLLQSDDRIVTFEVQEFYKGNRSAGGSSLYALVKSYVTLEMCGYKDFFNGTYLILCAAPSQCVQVNISVHHLGFTQFQGIAKRQDIQLLSTEICVPSYDEEVKNNTWMETKDNGWRWHTADLDYPMPEVEFCRYVDAMTRTRFYMIGSSHMEHQHRYIMTVCLKYMKNLQDRLYYVPARYGIDVIEAISDFLVGNKTKHCKFRVPKSTNHPFCSHTNETNVPPGNPISVQHFLNKRIFNPHPCKYDSALKTGMLMQIGSWDLSYNGLKSTLKNLQPKLNDSLHRLAQFLSHNKSPSIKVAMMGPPSNHKAAGYVQTRNNDILQVFDQDLRTVSEQNNITFVSVFGMMYPRHQHITSNSHYIKCGLDRCQGEVGIAAIQMAVKALATSCEHF